MRRHDVHLRILTFFLASLLYEWTGSVGKESNMDKREAGLQDLLAFCLLPFASCFTHSVCRAL